ncbi:DoxX family protein [Geojedonia litorea]|uniref:DoxX family protein n=1 Tax=Geojedonia litorea TaxID=1268269 RepID=A0ABV9N071_9FLAO
MKTNYDLGLLIIRIIIAFPMLIYGISKLFNGIDGIIQLLHDNGLPAFLGYGVYIGEIIAPIFILLGYKVRFAAAIFAFNCIMALFLTQTHFIFKLNANGGMAIQELAIFIGISIGLMITGSGKFGISQN